MRSSSLSQPGSISSGRIVLGAIVLALGIQAIVTQSLLLREALVLMFGSELAWGVVLFAWLAGVAVGGAIGGRLESKLKQPELGLVTVLVTLSVAACIELWLFRSVRSWLGIGPGEYLTLPATALVAMAFITPASALVGMAFPFACRIAEQRQQAGIGPLGRVYALESAGSLVGGAAFSFWAVEYLSPIEIAMLCAVISILASAGLLAVSAHRRHSAAFLATLAVATLLLIPAAGPGLHRQLVHQRWKALAPGYELVAETDSRYQNLAVGRLAEQFTLYCDGQITVDFPDPYTFIPLAHFWMCQHPAPQRVLLLGGGAEGVLREILRHPVESVDYVEPDPRQIEIIAPYLEQSDRLALDDDRVQVHHQDARYFIKTQRQRFDLVIARLPEPTSALRARFYTREFFGELRRAMTSQSVLCMTVAATPGELTAISGEYLASVRATLRTHFPIITIGWGDPAHVLAATDKGLVSTDPAELAKRYSLRGVQSELFHPAWFEGGTDWLDPEKLRRRAVELDELQTFQVSTDLHPIVYLQRLVLWDRMTGGPSGRTIEWLRTVDWRALVLGLAGAAALILMVFRARSRSPAGWANGAVILSITTTGFATMALSIIWLFAFQSLYGYVYQRIGWIIAVFMGGLVLGCAVAGRRSKRFAEEASLSKSLWRRLTVVDVLLAALALSVPLVLPALGTLQAGPLSLVLVEWAVLALVASTGVAGGAAFALAGGLELATVGRAGKAAGHIVAADHAGACAGALLTGILLVPVYGTATAALLLAGMKLVSAALLAATGRHRFEESVSS